MSTLIPESFTPETTMSPEFMPSDWAEVKQLAGYFSDQSKEQLDNRLIGEEEAKLALQVAMVTGANVALIGEPGGGKTTLASDSPKLISDIRDEQVARVPHNADLTAQQLIGGTIETTHKTKNADGETEYTQSVDIASIITPETMVLWLEELNRTNPFAVNAILGGMEDGKILTTAGVVELQKLMYGVTTMNPSESRQATFPVAAATASRHALGVVLGGDRSNRDDVNAQILDGWTPKAMTPVITSDQLMSLRVNARQLTMPVTVRNAAVKLVSNTVDALAADHKHEADARIAKQVGIVARGIALLNKEDGVQLENVKQAVRFVTTARLGILGTAGASGRGTTDANLYDRIQSMLDSRILNKSV